MHGVLATPSRPLPALRLHAILPLAELLRARRLIKPSEGTMLFGSNHGARRAISLAAICAFVVVIAIIASASQVLAEGFRIQTKIFVGEEPEPVCKTTTLFQDGAVYDFLEKPEQTAVFRRPMGNKPARFILLNDQQQVQTEVSTEKLTTAMKNLRTWAAQQNDPFLQFAANPRFDETYDRETGKLVLTSSLQTYTVETNQTQHQDSLGSYREFLDWYSQLNTLLSTPIPPDPRLKLNESLARHKAIPTKVELKRDGEDPVRAEHDFTWKLSQKDLERIDDVRNGLTKYKTVENAEFLQLGQPVNAAK
jgi:hypothetical protein